MEVIVLGAGLAGASAAWHLTGRGHSVTVLERSTPGNAQGSSHGSARIFRYAYPEQLYADLVVRARRGWDDLEQASGRELITTTGCVDFGRQRGPQELASVLSRAGVEHELLSPDAAAARWPQIAFSTPVLWQPTAGVLDPDATIETMLALACSSGRGRVLTQWEATRIETTGAGVRVHSATGETVDGARIVVAAGGWLPDLLAGAGLPTDLTDALPALEVRQEQAYHFPYRESAPVASDGPARGPGWPAFIHKSATTQTYGLPGGRDADFRGQKVAQFNGGPVIASARVQDGRVRDENRELMTEYVRRYLPGLVPEPYAETTCLFTNTPTEDFIIDARETRRARVCLLRARREVRSAARRAGRGPRARNRLGARCVPARAPPVPGVRRLAAAERTSEPWRNGHGHTALVAGDDDWRVSIAELRDGSPFSSFPGSHRLLMPLSPGGVALRVNGERRPCDRLEVFAFAGEDAVCALEVTAPVQVLNLIWRRDRRDGELTVVAVGGPLELRADGAGLIAVAVAVASSPSGPLALADGDELGPLDALWLSAGETATVSGHGELALARIGIPGR